MHGGVAKASQQPATSISTYLSFFVRFGQSVGSLGPNFSSEFSVGHLKIIMNNHGIEHRINKSVWLSKKRVYLHDTRFLATKYGGNTNFVSIGQLRNHMTSTCHDCLPLINKNLSVNMNDYESLNNKASYLDASNVWMNIRQIGDTEFKNYIFLSNWLKFSIFLKLLLIFTSKWSVTVDISSRLILL